MGCTSSHLLNQEEDFTHHIVSLTSTTYGLLTLDPSSSPTTLPPTPPPPFTLSQPPQPEVINSWELMDGLESTPTSFHFSPQPSKPSPFRYPFQENSNPNHKNPIFTQTPNPINKNPIFTQNSNPNHKDSIFSNDPNPNHKDSIFAQNTNYKDPIFTQNSNPNDPIFVYNTNPNYKDPIFTNDSNPKGPIFTKSTNRSDKDSIFIKDSNFNDKDSVFNKLVEFKPVLLDGYEELCPPKGENKVVIYTTSLRGVRKTFEACNAVRAVLDGFSVLYSERDVSMDRGFREELSELLKGKDKSELVLPRVFVKGRYVGGSDELLNIVEEGCLGQLLDGLPKSKPGYVCETCGGARFLPCCSCSGSCKVVMVLDEESDEDMVGKTVTVRCTDCNENGLVRCPVCS